MKDFKGKVAVITGAASGIGRAFAENVYRHKQCLKQGEIARKRKERDT